MIRRLLRFARLMTFFPLSTWLSSPVHAPEPTNLIKNRLFSLQWLVAHPLLSKTTRIYVFSNKEGLR